MSGYEYDAYPCCGDMASHAASCPERMKPGGGGEVHVYCADPDCNEQICDGGDLPHKRSWCASSAARYEAKAVRADACVNALAGVSDPAALMEVFRKMRAALEYYEPGRALIALAKKVAP